MSHPPKYIWLSLASFLSLPLPSPRDLLLLYVGQVNGILKICGPVLRNQFYLAPLEAANQRRLPATNESE